MKIKKLTDREATIMKAIWEIGEGVSTAQIVQWMREYGQERVTPQAVSVYVDKLERKGFIEITRPDSYYKVYVPLVTRDDYIESEIIRSQSFWNAGAAKYSIMALKNCNKISLEEKNELRSLLDEIN